MNRKEALRILGLPDDATAEDVRVAYRETAQILHPDRFASNKKLQERATEHFKNLQEAYECLSSGKGSRSGSTRGSEGGGGAAAATAWGDEPASARDIEARLAGIAAARVQLVAQRDLALDERRNGAIMAVAGAALALVFGRKLGVLAVLAAIGATLAVWGGVQAVGAHRTVSALNDHLAELTREKKRLLQQLEDME